ncbi:Molecular chaperone DnaK (HSP70) [Desulfocicer vacuolatum DSM 3385]|uniref:Molecular chaperone DnaK (HSP70) n=1 Tax=Desulfocicer vacuolatum DSM 3385 TaxID=1121400 RepID=A0A1W2E6Z1_9BACT|nr:Hsp70 family protein [Desulfocicer vacuolatum]SMD04818.1 Molecular chaperone DnaK (HSP70) [Desulfocicer vacuolatum DSM 3385]
MEPIIGIDLGTTNSEVGFIVDGKTEILKEKDNGIVPSCVGLTESGTVIVGIAARNQATLYPEKTVLSIKRLMGSNEQVLLGENHYTPQEISAFILKELKERAQRVTGKTVSKAVITTPAYFTDIQRQATREAGEIAGLTVVRILNEPTAAALAYESSDAMARTIMVYDLGGGTFDVSIVRIEDGVVEVLSSTGDNHLGGDDFDHEIEKKLLAHLKQECDVDLTEDLIARARLKRAAEKAKIELSSAPYAAIEEDHIAKSGKKDVHLSYELSRMEFEDAIDGYLQKTMESVNKALKDADILPSALEKIILVGGSTRIPKLSVMLEETFGILPNQEIDPDLCVAMGAAIQAGREMGLDSSSVLLDVTPYTFGTAALGELDGMVSENVFVPLIRRNSKLPAIKSEVFWTVIPDQVMAKVEVYQGENSNTLDNVLIGTYNLDLSPRQPPNSPVVVKYELDLNGILKVTAIEKNTGKRITGVIENAFSQISHDGVSMSKSKIDDVWASDAIIDVSHDEGDSHRDDGAESEPEGGEFQALIANARELLEDAASEDSEEIINLIEDINNNLKEGNLDAARESAEALEDILFYLE